MIINKENAKPILIYVVTLFLLVAIFYFLFNMYVVADEIVNPCDVCIKNNPSMQTCIERYNKEMFTVPSLNLTVPVSSPDSQQ